MEVFFGVDADGVEVGGLDVDVYAVFEEAELFETFGLFKEAGRESGEALECGFAVPVDAYVLPVLRRDAVSIVRNCGAGEVECAAVRGGDHFDGVWVGDVLGGAQYLQCRDLDLRLGEGT